MRIPRWAAIVAVALGLLFLHVGLPFALSLLAARYGWIGGVPSLWNAAGFVLVLPGVLLIAWVVKLHYANAPQGWKLEMAPSYLLSRGPYRYTRNPMYLGLFLVWLAWTIFYGSIAVLVGLLLLSAVILFILVPLEERALEKKFGEEYRRYKAQVPRWFRLRK